MNEAHVGEVLRGTFAAFGITPSFAMLAFDQTSYVLYIDTQEPDLEPVVSRIETELRRNFHYDYARLLGQLGPLRLFRVNRGAEKYLNAAVAAGQRAGDVKPVALERVGGWVVGTVQKLRAKRELNRGAASTQDPERSEPHARRN